MLKRHDWCNGLETVIVFAKIKKNEILIVEKSKSTQHITFLKDFASTRCSAYFIIDPHFSFFILALRREYVNLSLSMQNGITARIRVFYGHYHPVGLCVLSNKFPSLQRVIHFWLAAKVGACRGREKGGLSASRTCEKRATSMHPAHGRLGT